MYETRDLHACTMRLTATGTGRDDSDKLGLCDR